jgi:hypothetical protein
MENADLNIIGGGRCENLRWKGLFVHGADAPEQDSICWCLKTQLGIGPDGALVSPDECGPGRTCYKPL